MICKIFKLFARKPKPVLSTEERETVEQGYNVKIIDHINKNQMKLKLVRTDGFKEATLTKLYINGEYFCLLLEPMWRNNQRDDKTTPESEESCIPEGVYGLRKRYSKKFGKHTGGYTPYVIGTQPERDLILFHIGNTVEDTLGCMLTGEKTGKGKSRYSDDILEAVLTSKDTLITLMDRLNESEEWKQGKDIYMEIIGKGTIV